MLIRSRPSDPQSVRPQSSYSIISSVSRLIIWRCPFTRKPVRIRNSRGQNKGSRSKQWRYLTYLMNSRSHSLIYLCHHLSKKIWNLKYKISNSKLYLLKMDIKNPYILKIESGRWKVRLVKAPTTKIHSMEATPLSIFSPTMKMKSDYSWVLIMIIANLTK